MRRREEAKIQAAILVAVTALPGAFFWRANTGQAVDERGRAVRFNIPGTPDILGCHCGRFVGIECKAPGGNLSDDQKAWRDNAHLAGGLYIVARSVADAMGGLGCAP